MLKTCLLYTSTSSDQNVTVTVKDGTNTGTVYHVNVTWGDLTFEYQKEGAGTWAVSYTHLDVYKRQGLNGSHTRVHISP